MSRKKILFIGGSLNQTTIMHQISQQLDDTYDCFFTPYYADPFIQRLANRGWADFSTLGGNFRVQTDQYFRDHKLSVDFAGRQNSYDLVLTGSDLIVPSNAKATRLMLVQEGMTDPEGIAYKLVKWFGLPRFLASTATNGLSDDYGYFCVASDGYRDLFEGKGVKPEKMIVTGIPNFDNIVELLDNDFPRRNYVLVATSDARETFKKDNRKQFIRRVLDVAKGRPIIFKLHPNENFKRAVREIESLAPDATIMMDGDIAPMIANCDVLMTQYSTVSYIGLALGKEVHSYFDVDELKRLLPMQNGGQSSHNIAAVCRRWLEGEPVVLGEATHAHA